MSKEQSLNKLMKWYKIDKILTSCEIIFIVFKKKKILVTLYYKVH